MATHILQLNGISRAGGVLAICVLMGVLMHVDFCFMMPGMVPTGIKRPNGQPYLINLRRESVPVVRKGKTVSFRTSYSGIINVGSPHPQEFRVLFDTGSGHIVIPSAKCRSETCLKKERYDMSASETAVPINTDGSIAQPDDPSDRVTIGFGTGQVTGELVRDKICIGPAQKQSNENFQIQEGSCVFAHTVVALELSANPFGVLPFDGILGLGLRGLSLTHNFSFFNVLSQTGQLEHTQFSVFLTEGEHGEESELAIGGHNPHRLLAPISWALAAKPELGYWQVQILAVHVGDRTLDFCRDGSCHGIIDTGTSHLGIPAPYDKEVEELLTSPAGDLLDCRLADTPTIKIELEGFNLTLNSENYMRRLPLHEDVFRGMNQGVTHPAYNATTLTTTQLHYLGGANHGAGADVDAARYCRPRLMPVRMPPPMGPKLFILGEPVLHRYYTVFDWNIPQIGFGLAANKRQTSKSVMGAPEQASLQKEPNVYLMQKSLGISHEPR